MLEVFFVADLVLVLLFVFVKEAFEQEAFTTTALEAVFFDENAVALIAEAGFKIIDFAVRKEEAFTVVFFGIKTFTEEAFLGAFNFNEACADN